MKMVGEGSVLYKIGGILAALLIISFAGLVLCVIGRLIYEVLT